MNILPQTYLCTRTSSLNFMNSPESIRSLGPVSPESGSRLRTRNPVYSCFNCLVDLHCVFEYTTFCSLYDLWPWPKFQLALELLSVAFLSVRLSVCLLATSCKNYWLYLDENFTGDNDKEILIEFCKSPASASNPGTFWRNLHHQEIGYFFHTLAHIFWKNLIRSLRKCITRMSLDKESSLNFGIHLDLDSYWLQIWTRFTLTQVCTLRVLLLFLRFACYFYFYLIYTVSGKKVPLYFCL